MFAICEKIFEICEDGTTDITKKLNEATTYAGSVARKVFLIERVASLLLRTREWNIQPYDTFKCAWSALGTNRFKDEAVISDALKLAYNEVGHPVYLSGFSEVRNKVFFDKK